MTSSRERVRVTVREACDLMASVLAPAVRRQIVDSLRSPEGPDASFGRLRRAMRSHVFPANGGKHSLARVVQALDQRTKAEGFHVLESWDYVAHEFADEITPVLMLDRYASNGNARADDDAALSILIDQYFISMLGLLVARAWDDADPNLVFDDVTRMLGALGDEGHRFVGNAATLLLLAVSHYHPREAAYDTLIERIALLDDFHRLEFALACAPVMSGHFRWGFRFMYGRDFGRLRDDNVVDFPWLLFAVRRLVEEYCRDVATSPVRITVLDGLLGGLSADPRAFTERVPKCLAGRERDHEFVRATLLERRDDLLRDLEAVRPSFESYSPLGFSVNFLCNAHVAMVATALNHHAPHPSLDALLGVEQPSADPAADLQGYAKSLMDFASGGRATGAPALIIYDPHEAQHAYNLTVQVLSGT